MKKINGGKDGSPSFSEAELESLIAKLEQRRSELQSQLPAHSISPSLIAELDDLDDEIEYLKSQIDSISKDSSRIE